MQFERDDVTSQLADATRSFLADRGGPRRIRESDDPSFDLDLWNETAAAGWLDVLVPETEGGLGLGAVEAGAVCEEAGRGLCPGPLIETMVVSGLLRATGMSIASGSVVCFAFGEPDTPDQPAWGTTVLHGGSIDGEKVLVSHADVADVLIVVVGDGDQPALAVVDPHSPGIDLERQSGIDFISRPCRLTFTNTAVEHVIATADARPLLARIEALMYTMIASRLLGVMDRILEMSVAYACERHQFGRPIASFQAIAHILADMATSAAMSRSACYTAQALLSSADPDASRRAQIAKSFCSSSARDLAESALQVHGGIGFTNDSDLHFYYRHALALEAAWGDADMHSYLLGSAALKRATDPC